MSNPTAIGRMNLSAQVTGAVSYYFDKHNLLQADATNIHRQPAGTDGMQYRLQAQVIF